MSSALVEVVRLGPATKTRLITLKRRTGIDNWNVLCRWAFCLSLQDSDPVGERHDEAGVSIEMTWKTFGGELSEVYEMLLLHRANEENANFQEVPAAIFLRRHVTRGVSRLVGTPELDSIDRLFFLDTEKRFTISPKP